ncbi:MAG: glycosyltransferase [Candidatus Omnitrophica bacterium]|nr:glycosyltransferase [Candidatus Omnitrophota bacterium]
MSKEKLAIIIPTKDRQEELMRLLASILKQGYKPFQIIVVDGGNRQVDAAVRNAEGPNIDYLRKFPPSLTAQRNAGIGALKGEVTIAAFLDDDIVLEEGSLDAMMEFWEAAPADVGGASFNLVNEIYEKPTFIEKLFMAKADKPNAILRSGFQGKIACVERTIPAQWMVGCAMSFRKEIFGEFAFDERFSGYARYEDVDFTYSVGKKHRMFVVADAKVRHLNKLEDVNFSFPLGRMEVINRLYFVSKHKDLSVAFCYWALAGILMNNVLKALLKLDKRYWNRAKGNFAGLAASVFRPEAKAC